MTTISSVSEKSQRSSNIQHWENLQLKIPIKAELSQTKKSGIFGEYSAQFFTTNIRNPNIDNIETELFLDVARNVFTNQTFQTKGSYKRNQKIEKQEAPGYDFVTGEIMKKLPEKAIIILTVEYPVYQSYRSMPK